MFNWLGNVIESQPTKLNIAEYNQVIQGFNSLTSIYVNDKQLFSRTVCHGHSAEQRWHSFDAILPFPLMFRSSCRGWRWSSARWPGTKRNCRETSWSSPSTHTCWRSHGPSYTAAPEWVHFCPPVNSVCNSVEEFPPPSTHTPWGQCVVFLLADVVLFPRVIEVEVELTQSHWLQVLQAAPDSLIGCIESNADKETPYPPVNVTLTLSRTTQGAVVNETCSFL